jgi:lipopolysaccharide/colanic/teichoic acid biosynthesis glycosyltransferase
LKSDSINSIQNEPVSTSELLNNIDAFQFSELAYFPDEKKFYCFVKRCFDLFVSIFGLLILSPVFVLCALFVKLEDGGPAIYKQKRIGKDGEFIYIYKFRSMKVNADKLEDVLTADQIEKYKKEYKLEDDPRITKIGNFLRKSSLDELPQLFNVIRGDISLIGPRPLVSDETYLYGNAREVLLSVKPGLTGYWQAYARNTVNYATGERQKMELYYVHNRGFWFDIKIFFKTFEALFKRTGAQ